MGKSTVKSLFYSILVMLTLLLGAVTVVGSYSGKYSPDESFLMPLIGLAVPMLLVGNLIVAICWAIARRAWAFVPLLAIAGSWNYLVSVISFRSLQELPEQITATRPTPQGYLTVATYNVHNFGDEITGYSCKEIARLMEQERVDVLCFQEFGDNADFPLDSIRKALAHWQYASIPANDSLSDVLPIAVFSRFPLTNERFISYPQSANCSMMCDVVLENDTVRLLNNHLQTTSVSQKRKKWARELATDDTRREALVVKDAAETLHENFVKRAAQTDSICRLAQSSPHPVLVCGDFNSLPSSYTYYRLKEILSDGFITSGRGYMHTFRYGKRLLRIDYIFHSSRLEGLRYFSPDVDLCSDHNPVIFSMKL